MPRREVEEAKEADDEGGGRAGRDANDQPLGSKKMRTKGVLCSHSTKTTGALGLAKAKARNTGYKTYTASGNDSCKGRRLLLPANSSNRSCQWARGEVPARAILRLRLCERRRRLDGQQRQPALR